MGGEFLIDGADFVGGGVFDPAGEPEAGDADVAEDEDSVRDGEGSACHGSVGDVVGSVAEEVHEAEGAFAADGVEGDGCVFSVEDLEGGLLSFFGVREDVVCAEGGEVGGGFGPADEVDGAEAELAGDLDDALADGGGGGVLDDPIAGVEGGEVVDEEPCGGGVDLEHGGLEGIDGLGEEDEAVRRNAGVGGPGGGASEEGDDGSVREVRVVAGFDDAAAFDAGGGGECGFYAVGAFDEVEVRGVDGCGEDSDEDFPFGWGGGEGFDFEDVGGFSEVAEGEAMGGVHGVIIGCAGGSTNGFAGG